MSTPATTAAVTRRLSFAFDLRYAILLVLVLSAVFGAAIVPYDPLEPDPFNTLAPPSAEHWFGTDQLGMDIFSRVVVATRVDFSLAFLGVFIGGSIGSILGAFASYRRGWLDAFLLRSVEVVQSFPVLLLGIGLFVALGQGLVVTVIAIVAVNVPLYLRHVRSVLLPISRAPFVEAAKCGGMATWGIVWRHLLPNVRSHILALFALTCGYAIQLIAGLSFIGLGVEPPNPEWGSMINAGATLIVQGVWWPSIFPGLALAISVFALSGIGRSESSVIGPAQGT